MSSNQKQRYTKKNPIEHVLDRPDMWVGSVREKRVEEYVAVYEEDKIKILKTDTDISPALLRVYVEALSNAVDNVERSRKTKTPCTLIEVNVNKSTGETSVWNDGDVVPIEIHSGEGCYNHTMIFGQLLTGSNYNDDETRMMSGRNGIGIKATSIFSKEFTVEGVDPKTKKKLIQKWTNNMRDTEGPVVSTVSGVKGYTLVKWKPEFSRFDVKGYTTDIVNLYRRYAVDAGMLTKIKVTFNGETLPVNNLETYAKLYENLSDESIHIKYGDCEVLVTPSSEFQAISFVNGVCTRLGGSHVDSWCEALFRPLVEKFNKGKKDKPQINIKDIKQFFRVFVVATVGNPEFDSQEKNKLESPKIDALVKPSQITSILKWSVCEQIKDMIDAKEMLVLKKVERKKKGFVKIEGMDQANFAGTKYSKDCTLILCEGLSAKTYAVAGIEKGVYGKVGRDFNGILPLVGKVLNTRNSSPALIARNKEVTNLIKAIGLSHGTDYTLDENFDKLRYGRIMCLTDADVDGIHIEGLILNMFHYLFPTLLHRKESFIVSMKTPIVRVPRSSGDLLFYDERKFKEFVAKQTKKVVCRYFKGLGTTKFEDVADTFGVKMIEYVTDENTDKNMSKIFGKKQTDDRKEWLENYTEGRGTSLDDVGTNVTFAISDFIDNEMIKFSIDDCRRSIPSGIDGLKQSQRKVLYAVRKRNLKYGGKSLKVAQLGGYVAEHTNYHHGEQNLYETITKMANEFPASNNIPLLYRDGQFGSRLQGGHDAASARYIFTKMDMLTNLIFRPEDDVLLEHVTDDGDVVEPTYYVPIIPMILVNGCSGIGTGWSSNVPCYNPLDMIRCIKIWLDSNGNVFQKDDDGDSISLFPELNPWYRGFDGQIEKSDKGKYITRGVLEKGTRGSYVITELPIGVWTNKYKDFLEDYVEEKVIKDIKNYSTVKKVNFVIQPNSDEILSAEMMKLHSYVYTSNMVMFNEKEQLRKYTDTDQIIDNFCKIRYELYCKRKRHQISDIEAEIRLLSNKERFIREVMIKSLNIMNVSENEIIRELEKRKYDKVSKLTIEEGDSDETNGGYEYLLRLQVRTFTTEKINKLNDDIKMKNQELKILKETSEKSMWIKDLVEFTEKYQEFLSTMEKEEKVKTLVKPKIVRKK
jgi:DNA topoisomerase-2